MKKLIFFTVLCFIFDNAFAQYTEVINSKRPGLSESPYAVGTDVIQAEAGAFYGSTQTETEGTLTNPIGGTLFLRYGKFSEKLEINANIAYQQNEIYHSDHSLPKETVSGLSQLNIGLKYMLYEKEFKNLSQEIKSWKKRNAYDKSRLIPTVGIYAGVNTNFVEEVYQDEGINYKAALLLQNDFTPKFTLLTNVIADKISSENSYYSYILTATYGINRRWSAFVENQGLFYENTTDFNIATGAAYLYSKNLQIDASIRTNFDTTNSYFIGGIGVSWRFDRHVDQIISPEDIEAK